MKLIFYLPLLLLSLPLHGFFGWFKAPPKKAGENYYDLVAKINGNGKNVSRFIKEELEQNERSLLDEAVKSGALTQNNYDNYFKLSQAFWIRNKLKIDWNSNQTEPRPTSFNGYDCITREHQIIIKEQFEKCRIYSPLFYSIHLLPDRASSQAHKIDNVDTPQLIKDPLTSSVKLYNNVSIGQSLLGGPYLPYTLLHEYGHLKKHHDLKSFLFRHNATLEKKYHHLAEFEADLFCTRKNSYNLRGFAHRLEQIRISDITQDIESDTHPAISERCKRLERAAQLLDAQQDYYKNIATSNPGRAYDEAWLRWYEKQNRREAKKAILAPYHKQLAQIQKIN